MHFELVFTPKAENDIEHFKKSGNKSTLKKIFKLLNELPTTPFHGSGKPEALKHELSGYWSRRIDREHRLIYEVLENQIVVLSVRGHY